MKRPVSIALIFASLLLLVWMFAQTPPSSLPDLARLVPAGPSLYIEAKDFGSLLSDWNGSDEKRLWLASDNFQVFSRSRLYLKLQQAQTEFAAAAGVPPDLDLLSNVAGKQSALAIYDIGKLEFLYITRLSSDRFADGALWKTRGSYQPRQSSGIDYYIKTDPASKRVAAFAAAKDYVVLATREDVLAGALALIAGQSGSAVASEQWFDKGVREAKSPGELRMVMDLEKLTEARISGPIGSSRISPTCVSTPPRSPTPDAHPVICTRTECCCALPRSLRIGMKRRWAKSSAWRRPRRACIGLGRRRPVNRRSNCCAGKFSSRIRKLRSRRRPRR